MKVVISAHMDLARPAMYIKLDEKDLLGLVDNFAGVFASYQASRKLGTPVYFTNYEELDYDGADAVAKTLDKDTLVIVVDTILESNIKGKSVSLTNAYGIDKYDLDQLREKFEDKIHFIDGLFEEKEDETWIYGHKYGLKTFYFGVPIPGTYYHNTENQVTLDVIDKTVEILTEVINWFNKK
jgi:putative aminopeptidase FrvX